MNETAQGIVTQIKPHKTGKSYSILLDDGEWYGSFGNCPYSIGEKVAFEFKAEGLFKNIVSSGESVNKGFARNPKSASDDTSLSIRIGQAQKQASNVLAKYSGEATGMTKGEMEKYITLAKNIFKANTIIEEQIRRSL